MAKQGAEEMIAVGLVGVGLGMLIGAAIASDSTNKRATFTNSVRALLAARHVDLLGAELGRNAGQAIWLLTMRLPGGQVLTAHVPVSPSQEPLAPQTARSVADRVVEHLRSNSLLAA